MKELFARISTEDGEETGGSLELSCQEVGLALEKDEVREGFFTVTGEPGQVTEGYVSCDEERMECLTSFFSGSVENIEYRFDSRGMREGEERRGRFLIVSNRGEYEVPFQVMVVHKELVSSEGELGNLFQFTNLARNSWEEAVKLFYSPDFLRVLGGQDRKYRNLYKGKKRLGLYLSGGGNGRRFSFHGEKNPAGGGFPGKPVQPAFVCQSGGAA